MLEFEDISNFFEPARYADYNLTSTYILLSNGTYYEIAYADAKKLTDTQLRFYCLTKFMDNNISIYRPR